MASRCRTISRPVLKIFNRAAAAKPTTTTSTTTASGNLPPVLSPRITYPRVCCCCVQSLIPLHSAVALARLTTRLGIEPRLLSQGMVSRSGPGV